MTPMKVVTVRRWEIGLAFAIVTAVFVVSLLWVQEGRLASCKRTYEGVRQVFQPFLTPPPKPNDRRRFHDYVKFNHRIDQLKVQCSSQVRLWWPSG